MKNRTFQDKVFDWIINILLVLIAIVCIYPIWFVLIASFSDPAKIGAGNVVLWPVGFNLDGYSELFNYPDIFMGYRNSIFYLFAGSFLSLAVTLPGAYALSRRNLVGRKPINTLFVISMYFSGGLIPTYMLHLFIDKYFIWMDTPFVLLVPSALNVYNMIIARTSFESLPPVLREAAQIDGCNEIRYFFQFALPLIKATIAVLFLFSALAWWNEYMRFVIYIDNPELQSVQVVIRQITEKLTATLSEGGASTDAAAALQKAELLRYSVVVVVALPFVLLYPFVQKYFNKGVMVGAVKG